MGGQYGLRIGKGSRGGRERPGALFARRTRMIRMCSLGQATRLGASRAAGEKVARLRAAWLFS